MVLSPKDGAYAACVSAAGRLSQLADVYDGNSGPRGDQLGQVRQIGGHYQHGRGPVRVCGIPRLPAPTERRESGCREESRHTACLKHECRGSKPCTSADLKQDGRRSKVSSIEVKSAQSVRSEDLLGLRYLKQKLGSRMHAGYVLYRGTDSLSFGDGLGCLPISALWTTGPNSVQAP